MSFSNFTEREYESLLRQGIAMVKGGNLAQARRLLLRAADLAPNDAQPWVWLSATTTDKEEQKAFLAKAVGIDPANAAARRGLAVLTGKIKPEDLRSEGSAVAPPPARPDESASQAYRCEKCGGSLEFDIRQQNLVCTSCKTVRTVVKTPAADQAEQLMDPALMGSLAHRWPQEWQRVTCSQCGSVILRSQGQQSDCCPYCASNRLVIAENRAAWIMPQVIGVMQIDGEEAQRRARDWLGKGWLAPDSLGEQASRLQLRPAYFPFWTFDGTLLFPWNCEVNEGSERSPRWVQRSGEEFEMFDDILVPGIKAMQLKELQSIEPFGLKELLAFSTDFLPGWNALMYDFPMAEASLRAREKVVLQARRGLYSRIEPGREKRNISFGAGKWSDMTYKQILLPLWVGVYTYRGKSYRLLVNGQNGKVGGTKPVDNLNLALLILVGLVLLAVLVFLIMVFVRSANAG